MRKIAGKLTGALLSSVDWGQILARDAGQKLGNIRRRPLRDFDLRQVSHVRIEDQRGAGNRSIEFLRRRRIDQRIILPMQDQSRHLDAGVWTAFA